MEFNTKDLMVTVLPKPELDKDLIKICLFRTRICRWPTFTGCLPISFTGCLTRCSYKITIPCRPCTHIPSLCWTGSLDITQTITPVCNPSHDPIVIQHLEDPVSLRTELQATLKSLDALQKELPSALSSKEEAEALEKSLTEALEQVRAAKKAVK